MLDPAWIRALPKVQLHCHLEGTVRAATFRALAARHGVESARARGPLEDTYCFTNFGEFLLLFAEVCKALQAPEDFAQIGRDYASDAAAEGVRYAEIFISPSVWTYFHRELDVREAVSALRAGLDESGRPHGLEVALICDLTRNFGAERALETARLAEALAGAGLGVVGIGLGGDEVKFPPHLYHEAFEFARAAGLHRVAHAGEAAGPASVRDAIEQLGAERIGHGVRALGDPGLVAEIAQRRIALEVCPTSNRLTGAVPPDEPHPIGALYAADVRCVLDADDPALFSTTLCAEYALVGETLGSPALLEFARNAIAASFAPSERKRALEDELDTFSRETAASRPRSVVARLTSSET